MNKIVGIKFTEYGKVHEFDSGHFVLKKGYKVLVETEQGLALGVVCTDPRSRGKDLPARPLKKVYRLATPKDMEKLDKKCQVEKEVYAFCYEKIKERSLPMCLVCVERLYDGSKIMIYFTADGRVDFRELVRDLVQKFRTRVEMRQIGVRHQAKMFGGLGTCGRQLCCASFLSNFAPVSIRMAKDQNLSLNPAKISGMCGRLMCCLTFEREYYEKATKDIPKIGKSVVIARGKGKVIRQNVLRETLTIMLDSGDEIEVPYDDILKDEI
jgi:cell fate regulator YaaT (PSP1 superfamily)